MGRLLAAVVPLGIGQNTRQDLKYIGLLLYIWDYVITPIGFPHQVQQCNAPYTHISKINIHSDTSVSEMCLSIYISIYSDISVGLEVYWIHLHGI